MSKINQIQNALRGLGQADFQKLADSYLHKKGYDRINSLGSVVGANKTRKGRPDTLIPLDNGKYVFAEYTTQQERVFEKLKVDHPIETERGEIPDRTDGNAGLLDGAGVRSGWQLNCHS